MSNLTAEDHAFAAERLQEHKAALAVAIKRLKDDLVSSNPPTLDGLRGNPRTLGAWMMECQNTNHLLEELNSKTVQQLAKSRALRDGDAVMRRVRMTAKMYLRAKNEGKAAALLWKLTNV